MRASGILSTTGALLAAAPLALAAQGGEGGGGGGLFDINAGLSAWTIIVFAILVFLLGKFAWGPILAAVEAREKGIQAALDEAARRQAEAEELLQEHKAQLADGRRQAERLLAEGREAGERVRREMEEKARAEAQALIERARAEIQRERDAAVDTLRKEAVDLTLAATARLLRERLDDAKDRQLIERYLQEMTEPEGRGAEA
ncbi:MAG: F0F1 ATP synthase subunit B [Gemmatimonadota bacterium]